MRLGTRCILGALLAAGLWGSAGAVTSFEAVKLSYRPSESVLLDRHGIPIESVRTDPSVRRLDWVPLDAVSPALREALILTEDRRFYEHSGVDWSAAGAAAWSDLLGGHTRGASTLTMQLAGLLDTDLTAAHGRSLPQKIDQVAIALAIERSWSKKQILEAYLNLVSFRGELVGIGAVSGTLFEKLPSGLNTREAAVAVALVRGPNAPAARVAERACAILKAEQHEDQCPGLADYTASVFIRHGALPGTRADNLAPHLARHLLGSGPGTRITSTLDAQLQRFSNDALHQQLAELSGRNVEDGAIIVLDNRSGQVLAYVGSSGDLSNAASVDNVLAARQAGSTLKPFLYELAIEHRWLTAASLLDDSPVDLNTANGLYIPQNYDHDFKGIVSLRTALGSSLNVPAVRTIVLVTPDAFHRRLKALGFSLKETGDYYGFSLALGSSEVSLMTLANAYRTLANGGVASPTVTVMPGANALATAGRHPVLDPAATFVVTDVLSDRNARALTFGLGNVLDTRYWSAVKTGTSKDMRDNWCVGFSKRYTVAVWVGNDSGQPMWDVSGVTGAAPVWHAVMNYLEARSGGSVGAPAAPPGVVQRHITFDNNLEAERDEWFVSGTQLDRVSRAQSTSVAQRLIVQPVDGTIIALDPDIPPNAQKLRLLALAKGAPAVRWRVDGKPAGDSARADWPLWPGHHHLELLDAQNHVLDALNFEVRGASLKRAL